MVVVVAAAVVVVVVVEGVDSLTNAPTCPINCSICLEMFQSSWDCGSCPIGFAGIAMLLLFIIYLLPPNQ